MSVVTSAIDALAGGALGALARLAPEVLAIVDKRNERKHEKEMLKLNIELEDKRHAQAMDIKDLEVESAQFAATMPVLQTAIEAQGKPTGVRWIDAFSATVRPTITYWIFGIYSVVKMAIYSVYQSQGIAADQALVAMWGPEDSTILSAVIMFWFVGRVWDRNTKNDYRKSG